MVARSRTRGVSTLPRTVVVSLLMIGAWSMPIPPALRLMPWLVMAATVAALVRAAAEYRQNRISTWRIVVLGTGPFATMFIEDLEAQYGRRTIIAGVVGDEPSADTWLKYRWLGPIDRLAEIVDEVRADRIVLALQD